MEIFYGSNLSNSFVFQFYFHNLKMVQFYNWNKNEAADTNLVAIWKIKLK